MNKYISPRWNDLRRTYAKHQELIMQEDPRSWAFCPYEAIDPCMEMSPIEFSVWCDIRSNNWIVLYPQFPIDGIFVDFANPRIGVAIECDGKEFHSKEKDLIRDEKLASLGWTVYRLTGKECCAIRQSPWEFLEGRYEDYIDSSEIDFELMTVIEEWAKTSEGILFGIAAIHTDILNDDCGVRKNRLWTNDCVRSAMSHESTVLMPRGSKA